MLNSWDLVTDNWIIVFDVLPDICLIFAFENTKVSFEKQLFFFVTSFQMPITSIGMQATDPFCDAVSVAFTKNFASIEASYFWRSVAQLIQVLRGSDLVFGQFLALWRSSACAAINYIIEYCMLTAFDVKSESLTKLCRHWSWLHQSPYTCRLL